MMPPLSIVIPVLDRAQLVRRAIASVLEQRVEGVEIIAVDGGSTDGTQEVIASFAGVRLMDAPNSSVYEAQNIGIRAARAPIIGVLNSDDRFLPGALQRVIAAAAAAPGAEIVRGRARFVALGRDGEPRAIPAYDARVARRLDARAVLFDVPAINACFVRASAYQRIGLYDETLWAAGDREWLLRAVLSDVSVLALSDPVYEYLVHSGSGTISAGRTNEARYVRKHLLLAERYLAGTQPAHVSRLLRAWHGHELVRLLLSDDPERRLGSELAHAFRVSPFWALWAVAPLLRTGGRRLRRRLARSGL
jgi:glycosyltransferase involved in cell wall biosynthesis